MLKYLNNLYSFSQAVLEEVHIDAKNVKIEEGAFFGCQKLKRVIITSQENVEISKTAFSECSNLKEIQLPTNFKEEEITEDKYFFFPPQTTRKL